MTLVGTKNLSSREVWLEKTISKIPKGSRILDAGAGELKYKKYCYDLNYVSQDFAEYDGKGDGKGLQTGSWDQSKLDLVCDICDIPEPNSSFDAIMCIEVIEHLPDPIKAISEFDRLLKPGGYLILTAPFCSITHFAPYHYYSGFNRYFYEKHLSEHGFNIIEIVPNGNYFEYLGQEVRRAESVKDQYSTQVKLSWFDRMIMNRFLSILENLSINDKGSSELLNFGYNVFAIKNIKGNRELD